MRGSPDFCGDLESTVILVRVARPFITLHLQDTALFNRAVPYALSKVRKLRTNNWQQYSTHKMARNVFVWLHTTRSNFLWGLTGSVSCFASTSERQKWCIAVHRLRNHGLAWCWSRIFLNIFVCVISAYVSRACVKQWILGALLPNYWAPGNETTFWAVHVYYEVAPIKCPHSVHGL